MTRIALLLPLLLLGAPEIPNGSITTAKLAPGAVTTAKLATLSVDNTILAAGAALANITNGSIPDVKLQSTFQHHAGDAAPTFTTALGLASGGTGQTSLSALTLNLSLFTSTTQGLVPASGGSATTFLNGAGGFTTPTGAGNVSGPGSSTDQDIVVFNGTTGKLVQDGGVSVNNVPTTTEANALAGTSGTPGSGNKYVTDADSRNTNARTPTAHASSHQNGGTDEISTATAAANAIPKAGAGGTLAIGWIPLGSSGASVAVGNDSRLSDARTPLAHATSHKSGGSDPVATATATANAIPQAGAGGTLAIGWFPLGSSATTVTVGNDSRLSDSRAPTGAAGGDLSGTYPNPGVAKTGGVTFAPSATTDTTNASNVTTGALPVAQGGTGSTSVASAFVAFFKTIATTLGDITYGGSSGTPTRLAGNTTTTKEFLTSTGSAGVATAPAWGTIASSDVSGLATSATTDTTNASNISSGTLPNARLVSVPLSSFATLGAHSYIGNNTGSTATPLAVTSTQLTADLNLFSSTLQGLTPLSGGGSTNYLRADGTWAAPAGTAAGITTLTGDVTASGSGSVAATVAKINGATLGTTTATSGHLLVADGSSLWQSVAESGDCTIAAGGSQTCTKTSGVAFATSATTDTTNASNITSGALPQAQGGTGTTTQTLAFAAFFKTIATTLGDLVYGGTSGTPTRLAGDTSNTKKFLREQSSGAVATAPAWDVLASGDIPNNAANTSGTSANVTGIVGVANGGMGASTTASSGNFLVGNGSVYASVAESGDCTLSSAGAQTCTKTNGVSFAASATTDTTVAGNITSGNLPNARLVNVPNSSLLAMGAHSYKGNNTGVSATASDVSAAGVTADLSQFNSSQQGVVSGSGGGTANFLRADDTWAAPPGTGITALTGDGTASGPGSASLSVTKTGGVAFTSSATTSNASTSTASNLVLRDANANFATNAIECGYTHVGSNTTTTLTAASAEYMTLAGGTLNLPDATTLRVNHSFIIFTSSSLIVNDGSGALLVTMNNGETLQFITRSIATSAGAWDLMSSRTDSAATSNAIVKRDGSGNFSAGTITAALTGTASGNTTYTANNHGVVVSSAANAMTVIAPAAGILTGTAGADPTYVSATTTFANLFETIATTLGDLVYGGTSGTPTRLAGDTSNTKKFLSETSSGGTAAAPTWATIAAADVPNATYAGSLTALVNDLQTGCLALTSTINRVTNSTSTANSVCLSTPATGSHIEVEVLNVANAVHVFPPSGSSINNGTTNAEWGSGIPPASSATLIQRLYCSGTSAGNWDCSFYPQGPGAMAGSLTSTVANAGDVGETKRVNLGHASAKGLTTATGCNLAATTCPATGGTESITLTAGDWSCQAMCGFTFAASTSYTSLVCSISTTTNTLAGNTEIAFPLSGQAQTNWASPAAVPGVSDLVLTIPPYQVLVAAGSTTTLFPVEQATFTASTLTSYGSMECRRMH